VCIVRECVSTISFTLCSIKFTDVRQRKEKTCREHVKFVLDKANKSAFVCVCVCIVFCGISLQSCSLSVPTALNNVQFVLLQWTHTLSKDLALNIYDFNKSLDVLSFKAWPWKLFHHDNNVTRVSEPSKAEARLWSRRNTQILAYSCTSSIRSSVFNELNH